MWYSRMIPCATRSLREVEYRGASALIFLILLICAFGCSDKRIESGGDVLIAPGVPFVTPGPNELGYRVNAVQLVTARFRGETYVFQAQIDVTPERVTFVGLDGFGRRALTVTYSGARMDVQAEPWLPAGIRPANMLADVAFIYWPEASVRGGLVNSAATLRSSTKSRSIEVAGSEVIHVDYDNPEGRPWSGSVRYRNLAYGYELDVQSVVDHE